MCVCECVHTSVGGVCVHVPTSTKTRMHLCLQYTSAVYVCVQSCTKIAILVCCCIYIFCKDATFTSSPAYCL